MLLTDQCDSTPLCHHTVHKVPRFQAIMRNSQILSPDKTTSKVAQQVRGLGAKPEDLG